jgi:hypothetical protein
MGGFGTMKEFIQKYEDQIHGVLSCFDRMLFRGYLPIMSGWQMAQFFNSSGIRFRELKTFLLQNAERVKRHALYIAQQEGRPHQYLQEKIKKEDLAKSNCRTRSHRGGTDLYFFCIGAMPHIFISD